MQRRGGEELDPEELRAHASNLDVLRARLGQVRATGERIGRDQGEFGPLCGWVFTGLGDRHIRQDELVAYVQENLSLAAAGVRRAANGRGDLSALAPDGADDATAAEPSMDPASSMDGVIEAINGREWVEEILAAAPVAEFAAPVTESVAALRQSGLDWAMENIAPLRRMMEDLAGTPEVVSAHAARWNAMAHDLRAIAADLRSHLAVDLSHRQRPDVQAYLALMSHNVDAISGLAATAAALALITKAGGDLILLVRDIVRGLIADLIVRVIVSVNRASGANAVRMTVYHLAAVVSTAWRIRAYVAALVASVITLSRYI